jgi:iron complex transport system substrate-binding protein
VQISLEQLLAWDPDVIIVNGEPEINMSGGTAADAILSGRDFATLKAVKNKMVFGTPNAPFSWVDRPPGPNRVIGMRWLAKKIYPEYFNYNVDDEVRAFFRLFYHTELTDQKLAEVYNGF